MQSERWRSETKPAFGVYLGKKVKYASEENKKYTGALYELDNHLGKNLRITLKLGTGAADTADARPTEETALGCRSLFSVLVSLEK